MRTEPVIIVEVIHIRGPFKGKIQEFNKPSITIGGSPTCDMEFPEDLAAISKNHAEIVREGTRFKLVDKSTEGTFVNGGQVKEVFLESGDVIMFSPVGPEVRFLTKIIDMHDIERSIDVIRPEPMMQVDVPRPPRAEEIAVRKVRVPLTVRYGPTLRSYKELPVSIGRDPENDLVIIRPSIADRHAQVFFARGKYWIRDLTGRKSISVNGKAIDPEAALNRNDILSLSPQGPVLQFLGDGRFVECE